jgi:site-specific recombinase XerD
MLRKKLQRIITDRPQLLPWDHLWAEFEAELQATGRSERTAEAYRLAVRQLRDFLARMGLPDDPSVVTAEHVRHFLAEVARHQKPATVNQRYRSLHRFFGWLLEEGEIKENPLARIPVPKVPQRVIPALRPEDVRRILSACDLKDPLGVRDYAIVLVLLDTGLRASELLSMRPDPSGRYEHVRVFGKGSKERLVRLGIRARQAVLRYVRIWRITGGRLWLDRRRRPLTRSGLYRLFERLKKATGIPVHPHLMRHTFATLMLEAEAPPDAVRALGGWETDDMLRRYTRSREIERALEVHRRFSPGDRVLE